MLAISLTCFATTVYGNETQANGQKNADNIIVELINFSVSTDYSSDEYRVDYITQGNKYIANIINKNTDEIVNKYSETPEIPLQMAMAIRNNRSMRATSYETTMDGFKSIADDDNFEAYVWARVRITYDTYWKQCDALLDCGHTAGSDGYYNLNSPSTYDGTFKYPSTYVDIDINGIIEITSVQAIGLSLSLEFLKSIGFTANSSFNWTARKSYNTSLRFDIMDW